MQKLIRKSTNATTMDAVGAIIRGKYTLLIIFALVTKALDASVKPVEKKVQGSMPADTISA
jgi:DNA-binding HxlR family transcriptional regulator